MEIKSQIPNCDYLLAVYALQYLPSYTVYETQCIYHSYYVQQNHGAMANACIWAPIRFSFVTFYTFQFLIQVLWF